MSEQKKGKEYLNTLKLKETIATLKFQRKELLRIIERGDGGSPEVRRMIEEGKAYLKKVEELLNLFGQGNYQQRNQN